MPRSSATTSTQTLTKTVVSLSKLKSDIDQLLDHVYAADVARSMALDARYGRLWTAMATAQQAGGKRLRPYMMMLAYEGLGGRYYSKALPVGAALEMLHTSLLIHDDIIDRDYTRHGQLNVMGQYREIYAETKIVGADVDHYAMSAALLSGDLALAAAYRLIGLSQLNAPLKVALLGLMDRAVFTVAGGELIDSELSFDPDKSTSVITVAKLKTAHYSFETPLLAGAMMAGASKEVASKFEKLGAALGIAFQLTDDIIGLFGDEAVTGKPATSDLAEGKYTYLIEQTLKCAAPDKLEILAGIMGRVDVTSTDLETAREIVRSCGALELTKHRIQADLDRAEKILDNLPISLSAHAALTDLINRLISRTY